jgi:hypothetical protein
LAQLLHVHSCIRLRALQKGLFDGRSVRDVKNFHTGENMRMSLIHLVSTAALLVSGAASATTWTAGTLLAGDGAPASQTFATLTSTVVGDDIEFTLTAHGLDLFSPQAGGTVFVGALAVAGSNLNIGSIAGVSGGVTSVDSNPANGPTGNYDFRFTLGQGANNRLTDDESATWTWLGGADESVTGYALHVQAIGYGQTSSAWYVFSAVPEPQTHALLAAGLALIGLRLQRQRGR